MDANGRISKSNFEDFYKDISAGIDDDANFELMMKSAWQIGDADC